MQYKKADFLSEHHDFSFNSMDGARDVDAVVLDGPDRCPWRYLYARWPHRLTGLTEVFSGKQARLNPGWYDCA